MTTTRPLILGSALIGALMFSIGGGWAMLAPESFFDVVARYPPYNLHLFHDLGAFQLGIAAALVAGIAGRDGLGVALWAAAVGASAHAVSHWIDADLGGRSSDPILITALAAVPVAGLVLAEFRGRGARE
ncbi:MAG: hypothetical protein M3400_02870 [Actinomycetota bacterium]|nr:hypothetical protein [Actinomycetota bacterium]